MKVIGQSSYGEIVRAEMDGNIIKSLSSGHIEYPENTYDGNTYFSSGSWGGDYKVNNITYKRGMELAEDFKPFFEDDKVKQIILDEDYYNAEGSWCGECGTFHDTEQYYDISYIITEDCELICKSCASAEDLLTPVESGVEVFQSKDITGMKFATEDFEEVETLFCDSSGFGNESERAMTQEQATARTEDLINKHGTLFAGLTGIGQFQVYVTLYKKSVDSTREAC